jgi:opacity protein-like surface antigen
MFSSKRTPGFRLICPMVTLVLSSIAGSVMGQVVPSAVGPHHALWVGGEYTNIEASFPYQSNARLWGIGGFADYHLGAHVGVEAEARFLRFNSYYGESEDNYLAGPRYAIGSFGKLQPYAQFLVGLGRIQYPFQIGSGSYLALAAGAGANYRIGRRWSLRGQYEYQMWPGSPNIVNEPAHQLMPNGIQGGVAFRLVR